jgi:hypothetical protein
MKIITTILACTCFCWVLSPLFGLNPDNPASEEFQRNTRQNRMRVEQLLKPSEGRADITWFAVPPMSDLMRLADVWPVDGEWQEPLRVILAQDEFEPASFQLFSLRDRQQVTFAIPDLKSEKGEVLSADKLDLKVVKIWYQNGNRWHSYMQDIDMRLVPELLLNDENLIRVDTKEEANYARIQSTEGDRYEWISAPAELFRSRELIVGRQGFNYLQEGFADAKTLQPVVLEANQFKQFFLTVRAEKGQVPGLYSGVIGVLENGKKILDIPISVRVLPFQLPLPKVWQDPERPFISSMIISITLPDLMVRSGYEIEREEYEELQRKILVNLLDHSMYYPSFGRGAPDKFLPVREIELMKELGFPTKPVFVPNGGIPFVNGNRLSFDRLMTIKQIAKEMSEYYMEHLGHNDLLISYGDEQGTTFFVANREFYPYFLEYGIGVGQHAHSPRAFSKAGYAMGYVGKSGLPNDIEEIRRWRVFDDVEVSWYAVLHTGVENPVLTRRQEGLLSYLSGITMNYNYRFSYGSWNDWVSDVYRSFVMAYLTRDGLVDTLQWEGYREAIDDIRYATVLQQEVRDALASDNFARQLQARKVQQYLAQLDAVSMDLNTVRMEMIAYILTLQQMRK